MQGAVMCDYILAEPLWLNAILRNRINQSLKLLSPWRLLG